MQFRSVSDLNALLASSAHSLPRDLDLIVGIPRSGLLAATLLALHRNLPLTDLSGFLQGRLLGGGGRLEHRLDTFCFEKVRKVLVIDDSLFAGSAMERARKQLADVGSAAQLLFAAVYVAPGKEALVDYALEVCTLPRVFEWNVMHHSILKDACVDIDGVLCADPTVQQNDDGDWYKLFLKDAQPLHIPSVPVGTLVTCRLEKYRKETEDWLVRHDVKYNRLVMLDQPTAKARQQWGLHGEYKGEVYKTSGASLFIESSLRQAVTIADTALKPVFSIEGTQMVYPSIAQIGRRVLAKAPATLARRAKFAASSLGRRLLKYAGYASS
jgi:uncharacterized HAD superfamily protein